MIVEDLADDTEWMNQWNRLPWRQEVSTTLYGIIHNPDTAVDDRLAALKILNESVRAELLPRDPWLPHMTCQVLMWAATDAFKVSWWRRRGLVRRQSKIAQQLYAVRWILMTADACIQRLRAGAIAARNSDKLAS